MQKLTLDTSGRDQAVDLTARLAGLVAQSGVAEGWCEVHVPHTTAGITVNEAADPDVMADLLAALDRLVPWRAAYRHGEGNSAAHVKAVLTGSHARLPVAGAAWSSAPGRESSSWSSTAPDGGRSGCGWRPAGPPEPP